jgi:hypothetical protein
LKNGPSVCAVVGRAGAVQVASGDAAGAVVAWTTGVGEAPAGVGEAPAGLGGLVAVGAHAAISAAIANTPTVGRQPLTS